ncbi:MAG: ATP-dependent helicase [Planctomycetota bacterium]
MTAGDAGLVDGLNEAQREAVLHGDGPLLVVAGAGTGKTRVVTRRVAMLLARGARASGILAITFTNKAAREMRERVESLVGPNHVLLCTYHSLCARILRRFAAEAGFTPGFSIYDRDESLKLLADILKEKSLESPSERSLLDGISLHKQEGLLPAEVMAAALTDREKLWAELYALYDTRLKLSNAMDFDDLLMRAVRLLRSNAAALEWTRAMSEHLLVDEYQDTNRLQYEIVKLLGHHGRVCATGDPDQAIYTWRGADIRNILDFERDFPSAKVVLLEENYRSAGNILKAASAVIRNNTERKERGLKATRGDGELLKLVIAADEREEAREVATRLIASQRSGNPWNAHAVFYRTNAQTRLLERMLRERGIPYRLVGAVSFYARREIKDLLAYLSLLANPADGLAFFRVVNTPKRALGKTTLEAVSESARAARMPALPYLRSGASVPGLTDRARRGLKAFIDILESCTGSPSVRETLLRVIEASGYEAYLKEDPEGGERLENVQELLTAAGEFDQSGTGGLEAFLADSALVSQTESAEGDARGVTLMTLHSAKGLEFDHVHFIGLEEELMPHLRSLSNPRALEEERRLMYVGITRARDTLTLYRAERRLVAGLPRELRASRFLAEIPSRLVDIEDRGLESRAMAFTAGGGGFAREESDAIPGWDDDSQVEPERPAQVGDSVMHDKFGRGRLLSISGAPGAHRVRIQFNTVGVKQLIWELAPLKRAP